MNDNDVFLKLVGDNHDNYKEKLKDSQLEQMTATKYRKINSKPTTLKKIKFYKKAKDVAITVTILVVGLVGVAKLGDAIIHHDYYDALYEAQVHAGIATTDDGHIINPRLDHGCEITTGPGAFDDRLFEYCKSLELNDEETQKVMDEFYNGFDKNLAASTIEGTVISGQYRTNEQSKSK